MNFVIWGAGARGRRLLRFLGKERVLGYIDGKKSLQGTVCDGIPILAIDDYLKDCMYNEGWIINSPRFLRDDIQKEIYNEGIKKYFNLSDCPDEFYDYQYKDLVNNALNHIEKSNECYIYGLNLYSVLLYEEIQKRINVTIVIPDAEYKKKKPSIASLTAVRVLPLSRVTKDKILHLARKCTEQEINYLKSNGFGIKKLTDFSLLKSPYYNKQLEEFKDKYKGKRCFIVATGPSLRMEDLETLRRNKEFCISMNGIYLGYSNTKWRPDLYVMTDPVSVHYKKIIQDMKVRYKIISDNNMDFWESDCEVGMYRLHMRYCEGKPKFSENIAQGVYSSGNVTFCCIQLAAFMGFSEIFLLGVDFWGKNRDCSELTHFVDAYDRDLKSAGVVEDAYNASRLRDIQFDGYLSALHYAEKAKTFKIYNATRGGWLEMFERIDFDELFEN